MNYFMIAIASLYIGATGLEISRGNYLLATVYGGLIIVNSAMVFIK